MSENIARTRRAYQAFNDGDLDGLLELMDADVEATPRLAAMEGAYHGHEGIRRWLEGLLASFPDFAVEILEIREKGERTFATVRARGHGAGSATPLDETVWHFSRWREGKCIRWGVYTSERQALEADLEA